MGSVDKRRLSVAPFQRPTPHGAGLALTPLALFLIKKLDSTSVLFVRATRPRSRLALRAFGLCCAGDLTYGLPRPWKVHAGPLIGLHVGLGESGRSNGVSGYTVV